MDVKNAYINENMRRDVRCKLPPVYTIQYLVDGSWVFRKLRKGQVALKVSLQVVKVWRHGVWEDLLGSLGRLAFDGRIPDYSFRTLLSAQAQPRWILH